MELELDGSTAYITGGAKGIGAAIADALAAEGVRLAVSDIDADALEAAAPRWATSGGDAVLITADLSGARGALDAAEQARRAFGGAPHIVINNVGVAPNKDLEALDEDDWQRSFELNLMAAVRTCRVMLPAMADNGGGSVVTISSGLAKQPEAV